MLDFKIETFPHNLLKDKINILIIEDNMDDYYLYKDSLADLSYPIQTKWIEDGEEAIQYLNEKFQNDQEALPNIIMIDKNLPGISGIELLEKIKSNLAFENILTLMVTGDRSDETYESAFDNGIDSFVVKNPTMSTLATKINHAIITIKNME